MITKEVSLLQFPKFYFDSEMHLSHLTKMSLSLSLMTS